VRCKGKLFIFETINGIDSREMLDCDAEYGIIRTHIRVPLTVSHHLAALCLLRRHSMNIVQPDLWDHKVCRICGRMLPFGAFYKQARNRDGLRSYCKSCNKKKMHEWRDENRERFNELRRKEYALHTDRIAKYAQTSKAVASRKALVKRYQKEHPKRYAEYTRVRNHRKRGNGGSYTADEWQALCVKYNYRCVCCRQVKPLTVDHVIPISQGGTSLIDNLQPLCRECNSKKGIQAIDYRT
jgi:5-methylcytosine-specific restriction endonuclease McrA